VKLLMELTIAVSVRVEVVVVEKGFAACPPRHTTQA
jgi:hypothetical protein